MRRTSRRNSSRALRWFAVLVAALIVLFAADARLQARPARASGVALSLDFDISDGACTDIDPAGGAFYLYDIDVGVCLTNSGSIPVAAFQYTITYDDTIINAPEVADASTGLDDNPDANAGITTFTSGAFPNSLGSGWDCSGGVGAYPIGQTDGVLGDGDGTAYSGGCISNLGPNTLTQGPLGVVTFSSTGLAGIAAVNLVAASVTADDVTEIGSCNPIVDVAMSCVGGTVETPCLDYLHDFDCDHVLNSADNCINVGNPYQIDSDRVLPNGPNVPGDDATLPGSPVDPYGDNCDSNDDNDYYSDSQEEYGLLGDCPGATDYTSPLKMDSDGDHLSDKWECDTGTDPTDPNSRFIGSGNADVDGDDIPDLWEQRGYDVLAPGTDYDGDGCADLVEIASVDSNKTVNDTDRLAVARRALNIWAPDPAQDYALDISKNGMVDDPDRLFVARAALLPSWQPKSCP